MRRERDDPQSCGIDQEMNREKRNSLSRCGERLSEIFSQKRDQAPVDWVTGGGCGGRTGFGGLVPPPVFTFGSSFLFGFGS